MNLLAYGRAHTAYEHLGDGQTISMFGPNNYNQGWNDNSNYDARWGRAGSNAVEYDSSGNAGLALYRNVVEISCMLELGCTNVF